jgi:hypothetical protein
MGGVFILFFVSEASLNAFNDIYRVIRSQKLRVRSNNQMSSLLYSRFTGLTLEEMDELFGSSRGLAKADVERQLAIHRRLGLLSSAPNEGSDHKSSHEEKAEA